MEFFLTDAMKRRADEVAEWLHSVIDIPDSPPPHGESTLKKHFGIPVAFVESIREEDYHKCYEPRVVSIGPFHHGKSHLAPMENLKRRAVRILAEMGKVSIEHAYASAEKDLLINAKEYYDVSRWGGISDRDWCLMMFLDGCFVILFFLDYCKSVVSRSDFGGWFLIIAKYGRGQFHRDLLLLDNQLPFEVQRVLVRAFGQQPFFYKTYSGSESTGIHYMPLVTGSGRLPYNLFQRYVVDICELEHVHLLQSCRDALVGKLFKEETNDLAVCPSLSVTELKKVGIRCSYAMDRRDCSLTNIYFESYILSGHLFLPQLTMDEWTLTLFSNLRAYEYSLELQDSSIGITAYLSFMSVLIKGDEDVKELRARGVLQVDLKDGEDQVVSFLRDITAHRKPNDLDFAVVKQRILTHLNSKRQPLRIAYAELKQRYFSGPWSFLVFLAVIFTVSMTVIQTVLTGIQTFK